MDGTKGLHKDKHPDDRQERKVCNSLKIKTKEGFFFIKVPFDEASNYRIISEVKVKNKLSLKASNKSLRISC